MKVLITDFDGTLCLTHSNLIDVRANVTALKLFKNQKFLEMVFVISDIAWIQSAFSAIYGPIIKLRTVIGIRITKYNFSVVVRVLNDTWILPQE